MYERLLDKTLSPSFADLLAYSGESAVLWEEVDAWLQESFAAAREIRFPYGNTYGWSAKYARKKKHICDAFAENGAFCLHFRISDGAIQSVYGGLSAYAKGVCDDKYPCSGGGWLSYRVYEAAQLDGAKQLLAAKMTVKS